MKSALSGTPHAMTLANISRRQCRRHTLQEYRRKIMQNVRRILIGTLALTLLGLPLAPHGAAAQTQAGLRTYEVTVTNITNSMQGLSPLLIATHPSTVHAWQMGQMASKGTELLAEEGMPDMLASELKGSATDVAVSRSHLLPRDRMTRVQRKTRSLQSMRRALPSPARTTGRTPLPTSRSAPIRASRATRM